MYRWQAQSSFSITINTHVVFEESQKIWNHLPGSYSLQNLAPCTNQHPCDLWRKSENRECNLFKDWGGVCWIDINTAFQMCKHEQTWVGSLHVLMQMPRHLLSSRYLHFSTNTWKFHRQGRKHGFNFEVLSLSEKNKARSWNLEHINTPLDQDFPSGRVTELTEHEPINHWHEIAVALASQENAATPKQASYEECTIIHGNAVLAIRSRLTKHHSG